MNEPDRVFLGLGTNLGDRLANLSKARRSLPPRVEIIKASSVYETPPWGYLDQPEFLNQVIEVRTKLRPVRLLRYLKTIEKRMGRVELFRYGPRLIDLDMLIYGERTITRKNLQIPHPRMAERAFVLLPLAEIAPNFIHPVLGKPVQELAEMVDTTGVNRL